MSRPTEETIIAEIRKMRNGQCGVKFNCLVWRLSENAYIVGRDTISATSATWTMENAAAAIRVFN